MVARDASDEIYESSFLFKAVILTFASRTSFNFVPRCMGVNLSNKQVVKPASLSAFLGLLLPAYFCGCIIHGSVYLLTNWNGDFGIREDYCVIYRNSNDVSGEQLNISQNDLKNLFFEKNITSVIPRQNCEYGGSTKNSNDQTETMAVD